MPDAPSSPAPPPGTPTPTTPEARPKRPPPPKPGLTLALSPDGQAVAATWCPWPPETPADAAVPLSPEGLEAALTQGGWAHWWRDEAAITKLLHQAAGATQPLTQTVAQALNARCVVQVARDKLSATVNALPAQGGTPLTRAQLDAALAEKGVRAGLLEDALDALAASGTGQGVLVAQGQAAVHGEATRFEKLVDDMVERHPHIDEDGMTDYRDLGDLLLVKAGTPLLRRVPPTAGTPGFDVTGAVLPAKPGTNKPFAPGLKGVAPDPDDPDLLVATVSGQPVMVTNGVKVDPTIVLPNVDLSTGNVTFDGAIQVKGLVKDGMKVSCTGDVMVGGGIEAGEIEAGGNVVIRGGVFGHSEYNGHLSDRNSWFSAKVHAKGSIAARYAENACLEAEGDVVLEDYAMHSEITSLTRVVIGKPGSRKGRCMGGHTRATVSIRVAEAGADTSPTTVLQAGHNPMVQEELDRLAQRIEKHRTEIANLQKIIDFVHAHPERNTDDLIGRAVFTQEMHQGQLLEEETTHADLLTTLTLADDAHIAIEGTIHGGTEVRLGGKVWKTADDQPKTVFRLDDTGQLVLQR